jgi:GPH family glycoside/pentoside/hexuronide:cation symporter
MMMTYTAINIPYTSLLGVISNDPRDRTQVSSIKFLFAFGAGTIVSASLLPLVKFLGAGNETRGWQLSFLVYGVAATAFFLVTFFGTRERVTPPEGQKTSVVRDLSDLFSNTPWLWLLFTTVAFILFVATRCSTTTYYFKYYVGTQNVQLPVVGGKWNFEALVSTFNTIGQVFSILGVLLVSSIANHFGKRRSFIVLYGVSLATTAAFYFLKPEQVGVMFVLQAVGSFAGSPLNALLWAMYADTADYGEWKNGRRATGLVFSASTMSQKFGWAIGAFVATKVMSVTGFQPNVTQTPESLHSLVLLVSLIPATVGLLAFIPLYFYQLDERKMKQITRELLERREQGAPTLASAQLPTAR